MADMTQVYDALRKADAAGDVEGARKLAAYIQSQSQKTELSASDKSAYSHTTPASSRSVVPTALEEEVRGLDTITRARVGISSAPVKAFYGAKQLLQGGTLSPEDQQQVRDWSTIEREAPAGAIAGNVAMALPLPSSTLPRVMASGAGYMALQPTTEQGAAGLRQRGIEALKGAGLGGLGYGGSKVLGRILNPQTSAEVKSLMAEGITPTPGQILGGGAKKAEEALRSLPIMGDVITAAHKRSLEDFNRAAINRSLTPIGKSLPKDVPVGYKAVDHAYQTISQQYDDLLPKLVVKADAQFGQDITGLNALAQNLNPAQAAQFNNILKNEVLGKFTTQGNMSGETMKQVEAKLGGLIRGYQRATDYDQQLLGDALQEAQSAVRKMVERGNPKYAGELSKVNTAYANLLRVENAAAKQGAKEGVFTPAQLESASRALDTSLRKRASAHGKALMQDLGTAGDVVLAQKLPDSGTASRLMYGLGGAGAGAGYLAAGLPGVAATGAGLGLGALAYTQPAQKALASLLTQRPELLRATGARLSDLAPYAGLAAVGAYQ